MDAETVADAVGRDRSGGPALRTGGGREYDYPRLCRTAMKAGNFFRLHGANRGALVGIADRPVPEVVASVLGAALLGARVRFGSPRDADPRLLVAPTDALAGIDPGDAVA